MESFSLWKKENSKKINQINDHWYVFDAISESVLIF